MFPKALLDPSTYCTDSLFLIVAVGNFIVYRHRVQRLPPAPAVHKLLQVIPAENAAYPPLGAGLVIPKVGVKAVGGEHHGPAAKFALQAVGVEHGLLAAVVGVLAGALGLYHSQRQAVLAKEDIIGRACPRWAGHALHRVFLPHVRIRAGKFPAHLLHVHIDVYLAGVKLGEVLWHKMALLLVLLLSGGELVRHLPHLGLQLFNFRFLFP